MSAIAEGKRYSSKDGRWSVEITKRLFQCNNLGDVGRHVFLGVAQHTPGPVKKVGIWNEGGYYLDPVTAEPHVGRSLDLRVKRQTVVLLVENAAGGRKTELVDESGAEKRRRDLYLHGWSILAQWSYEEDV